MSDDLRNRVARAMNAASQMRLALAGQVAFDIAAYAWDEVAEDAADALAEMGGPAPLSVREAGERDDSTPVDVSDKTKTTYFDSVPAIEAEMKLHKGRE